MKRPTLATRSRHSALRNVAVVSCHPLASNAGLRVLKAGGNAVDAAVATALTLGVVSPAFSGIGGGGFMVMYNSASGNTSVLDYREVAPLQARPAMFETLPNGNDNSVGSKAIATPTTLAGLAFALDRFGTKTFADVSKEAAELALSGFAVNRFLSRVTHERASVRKFALFNESAQRVLREDGTPVSEGDLLSFPKLGQLIQSAAKAPSVGDYYREDFARTIIRFVADKGGLLTEEDFAAYEPKVKKPVFETLDDGYTIASLPPPSAGGVCLVQLLKLLTQSDIGQSVRHNSAPAISTLAGALEIVYADRKKTIADPDFVNVDVEKIISDSYVKRLKDTPTAQGRVSETSPPSSPHSQTTHLSVIDFEGNVASLTESLECYFGSGVFVPDFDLFLNDTMHDFGQNPRSINCVEPGKTPRSSMSPTILFRDSEPCLVLGSAGGPRIISSTFQVILNVLKFGMDVEAAVSAPRIHHEDGKTLYLEKGTPDGAAAQLREEGYDCVLDKNDYFFGGVNAIQISGGKVKGAADPRRNGLAAMAG
jgi:gamma-glutamyltranspeptidase / glutathione hydrolase